MPAVVALGRYVGARQAFYEFGRWGFRFPAGLDEYGAGFILGNAEIQLLDLAGAYAGLARGGLAGRPGSWRGRAPPQERVASPEACAIITDILCDPQARRATFGAGSPLDFPEGVRVAVKTGTSSGFRDKWCVGFDGRHTVAVWAGHFDGRPMAESSRHSRRRAALARADGSSPARTARSRPCPRRPRAPGWRGATSAR